MDLPGRAGLTVNRTDFVPDGKRAALFGLTFSADTAQSFTLKMDAHSELMSAYPWGWTNPSQESFNLEDTAAIDDGKLVFREQGKPPAQDALPHDWAVVGSSLTPTGGETGANYREPEDPPVVCPLPSDDPPEGPPDRCDDTAFGKGKGGELRYDVNLSAGETKTVWFAGAGADSDNQNPADAKAAALASTLKLSATPKPCSSRRSPTGSLWAGKRSSRCRAISSCKKA